MKKNILCLLFLSGMFIASCGPNALSGLGSETSDEFYLEEALKANNSQSFDSAIDILLNKLSIGTQGTVKAKELLAGAYAGKCGFNFINYTTALSAVSGTTTAFGTAMKPFVGVQTTPSFCLSALQTMDSIGSPGQRTANQNAFTSIAGLVMMGASLRTYADAAPVNGDGVMDGASFICSAVNVSSDKMDDIIVGFGYFMTNFAYVSAALLGTSSFTSLNNVATLCAGVPGATCSVTNKASVTSATRDLVRDFINTTEYGIGSHVSGGTVSGVASACP